MLLITDVRVMCSETNVCPP